MGKIKSDKILEYMAKIIPFNTEKFTEIVIDQEMISNKLQQIFPNLEISTINVRELPVSSSISIKSVEELINNSKEEDVIFMKVTEELSEELIKQFSDIFRRLNYKGCKVILLNEDVKRTGQNYEGYPSLQLDLEANHLFRGRRNPLIYKNF